VKRKTSIILILMLVIILSGCNSKNSNGKEEKNILSGENPPNAYIEINKKRFETTLGTYCWSTEGKGICVDKAGPVELLEGKKPIQVSAGENINFVMDFSPKPNEFHVIQISSNGKEAEVFVHNNQFTVPVEKGVYYYSYGVWWMDEKIEHLSHGDAFYAFVLEVK
jgi:hypothetical protein